MCQHCAELTKALPTDANLLPVTDRGMWARNDQHDTWADLEDAAYLELAEATAVLFQVLMTQLGLPSVDVVQFEDLGKTIKIDLTKSRSDSFKYLPKAVLKYLADGKAWTRKELAELERLLQMGLSKVSGAMTRYVYKAEALSALFSAFDGLGKAIPKFLMNDLPVNVLARKQLPAPQPGREYRLRADKGASDQPVLPLTPVEEDAIDWAELHAGEKIATQNQYIKDKVRELVIEARRARWTPQELQQALLHKLGEFNRDWRRIANTELADAMSNGYVATLAPGDWVVGQANGDACDWCLKHIHGKTFQVSKTPGEPWKEVWVGKTNYGLRKAEWVPAIPAHPNCRCRWMKFNPKFAYIDENGRVQLKSAEQILAERQQLKSFFGRSDVLLKSLGQVTENDIIDILDRSRWRYADPHSLGANPNQVPMLDAEKLTRMRATLTPATMVPILIDRNGTILDGHHRWYVACEQDWPWVPVIVAPVRVAKAVEEAGPDPDVGATAKEVMTGEDNG